MYFPLPELITGGLLGDAYIGHHKRCKDAYLYVEQKDLELVLHLWDLLNFKTSAGVIAF